MQCPECGSENLIKYGKKWATENGQRVRKQRYQCIDCGRVTEKPLVSEEARNEN